MWDKLFAPADILQKGLEASWARNAVLRNNLANVETPGFKASDVEFESVFLAALGEGDFVGKQTRDKHINIGGFDQSSIGYYARENNDKAMRMDGNNVDAEAENVKLAQNSIQYNTLLSKLNSELARLKLAIREGK